MKKVISLLIILILSAGCSSLHNKKDLEESLENLIENESAAAFDLNRYVDFEWERAYLFPSYTSDEEISNTVGIQFHEHTGLIAYHDGFTLLLFVGNNKLVEQVLLSTSNVTLEKDAKDEITPENAIIKLVPRL